MAPNGSGDSSGNTSTEESKNKRCIASLNWCFTWNNYTDDNYKWLLDIVLKTCKYYVIGKEKGEQGTPHLQGYISFITKKRPMEIFKTKNIHWEKAKGDMTSNLIYCSKGGDYITNINKPLEITPLKIINDLRKWQNDLLNIIKKGLEIYDDRTIYWIYDNKGGRGKTALIKYLDVKFKTVISTVSNKSDVATLIRGAFYDDKDKLTDDINKPWLMLFNFQKDYKYNTLNYDTLEAVKDGLITATKYRGKNLNFNSPVVVVMANELPLMDINKRIKVYEFNDIDELIELN